MSAPEPKPGLLRRLADAVSGVDPAGREIFLCTGPDCCRREEGLAAWKHLKHRIKAEGLSHTVHAKRTACMNVCGEGPIAVVYPERTFYQRMNAKGLDGVIEAHLKGGTPDPARAFQPPDDVKEPPHRKRD